VIWLYPLTALALVGVAGPVLVHLLAQQKARRVPFPTLRFIQPFRLAAVRRRALDDAALLAVRVAIVAAAVAAMAGPFLVTAARKRSWDARVVRAHVVARGVQAASEPAATFVVDRLGDGIAHALAWIDAQPPGRREIVVRSPFPIGALTAADLAIVPAGVGLRFERSGALPAARVLRAAPVLGPSDPRVSTLVPVEREIELDGERTMVRDRVVGAPVASPIEIVVPAAEQPAADAVLAMVLADRIRAPLANRSARLVVGAAAQSGSPGDGASIGAAWMADAAARIARDVAGRGWGRTRLRFAAAGDRLVVLTDARASDPVIPAILRAVVDGIGGDVERPADEIVAIGDDQLRDWSRAPGPAAPPRPETIERDDRRWVWGLVLALLALETWMRRPRALTPAIVESPNEETARVA
jgi:hypothetical protein